jgi:plastocyanin
MTDRQIRTRIIRALGGAVVAAALVGAGTALAANQAVAISGFSFSPASITVTVGDTITWTNSDAQAHTATADDASWDTDAIAGSGGTGSATFATVGTFPYHCKIHPTMTGTVTVQAASSGGAGGGGGATTPPTDTAVAPTSDAGPSKGTLGSMAILAFAFGIGLAAARRRLVIAR